MSIHRLSALICAFIGFSLLLQAQSGPPGARVNDLLVIRSQPNVVYAATGGGVYRSTDSGASWANRSAGLPPVGINGLDGPSWRLYAATSGRGVWRSVNGGNWIQTNDVFEGATVHSVAVKPDDPMTVLASTTSGIYRSTDGGANWTLPGTSLPTSPVFAIEFSPFNPQVIAAAGTEVILRSVNGGASWTGLAAANVLLTKIAFDPSDAERIYFATNHGLCYLRPQNSSVTFVAAIGDITVTAVAVDPNDSNTLLVLAPGLGLGRSVDRGLTWAGSQGLPTGRGFALSAIPSESDRFLVGLNGTGVFASDDAGENWALSSVGLTASVVRALAVSPTDSDTVWAALDSGGLFKSIDGGLNWSESRTNYIHSGQTTLAVDPQDANKLYVGSVNTSDQFSGVFSRSVDGGATWTISPLSSDIRAITVDPLNGQSLLVGGSTGAFQNRVSYLWSIDGAESFGVDQFAPMATRTILDLTWDLAQPNLVWAIGFRNGIWSLWYSIDRSISFGLLQQFQFPLAQIEVNPTDSERTYVGTTGLGLLRTTPGAVAFSAANTGLPNNGSVIISSIAIAPDAPENLLVSTEFGVYRSDNHGDTWQASIEGLPAQSVSKVLAANGVAYAATDGAGLYKSTDHGLTWSPSSRLPLDPAAIVHGANFRGGGLAPGQIASVFGSGFTDSVEVAQQRPLPLALAGASVRIKDGAGTERTAELFFASPGQINFEVPGGSAPGTGTLTVHFSDGSEVTVPVEIVGVNPGLFASSGTGEGPAAAVAVRVAPNSTQTPVTVTTFNDGQHRTVPISVGGGQDPVVLLLFGSGIRGASSIEAFINGQPASVVGFGAQSEFVGLDQVNVEIPNSLAGAGIVEVYLVIDGVRTNAVTIETQ